MNGDYKYLILSGGIGGTKLAHGFYQGIEQSKICVLSNTGDDIIRFGLRVCPDIDILLYTLSNLVDRKKKWGLTSDTYQCIDFYSKYYQDGADWFHLGDKDIATHLYRTELLSKGVKLSEITNRIAESLGIGCKVLPMSEDYIPTMIRTDQGLLHFEEYFVKHGTKPQIQSISYGGNENSTLPNGIYEIFEKVEKIIIAPSNPILSISPILAIPKYKDLLRKHRKKVIAITPIIAGNAVKGPTIKNLKEFNIEPTPIGVCEFYKEYIGSFVFDVKDKAEFQEKYEQTLKNLNIKAYWYDTFMDTIDAKIALAAFLNEIVDISSEK